MADCKAETVSWRMRMKQFTQTDFNNFEVVHGRTICPTGDYTAIKAFPKKCVFAARSIFAAQSVFAECCHFAEWCRFGAGCIFDGGCIFDAGCVFGVGCRFSYGCAFAIGAKNRSAGGYAASAVWATIHKINQTLNRRTPSEGQQQKGKQLRD